MLSVSANDFLPPPFFLTRRDLSEPSDVILSDRALISRRPALMVLSAIPVALEIARTPPWPIIRASVAAHTLRLRSSNSGSIISYFALIASTTSEVIIPTMYQVVKVIAS